MATHKRPKPTPATPSRDEIEQRHSQLCLRMGNAHLSYLTVQEALYNEFRQLSALYASLPPKDSKEPTQGNVSLLQPTSEVKS